jgi:hypothetical protein
MRRARIRALAEVLLGYYSTPDLFWELVEGGRGTTLKLPSGTHGGRLGSFVVPSLDEHLVASLQEHSAALLHPRDLAMSTVGCGLVYALGYHEEMAQMLDNGEQEVRVFLCSPLGALPAQEGEQAAATFRPVEAATRWPKRKKTSAGLTQLMLAVLRQARS